jgi:hypothetical protein
VHRVVGADEVRRLALGRLAIGLAQKAQPLGMAVTLLALRDDFPIEDVEGGKHSVVVPLRLSSCVMAAARPFFSGKPGCVRCSACTCTCTWLFSSQHNTIACSGGERYTPTTSSSFSTNLGSRKTLNLRTRCGYSP